MTYQYPTGRGQSHTHTKILNDGSKNPSIHAGKAYDFLTLPQILQLALNPPSVSKNKAQWFIPSEYRAYDARVHSAQRVKGSFRFLTLDVDTNNLSISFIDEIVSEVIGQASRIIHSTRSATETLKKWRVLMPLANPIAGADFTDTQNAFFDLLEDTSNGALIPDRALARPAQLVYLPNKGEFYQVKVEQHKVLKLTPDHAIIRQREAKRSANDRAEPEAAVPSKMQLSGRLARAKFDGVSLIDHFNSVYSVAGMLERYGYKRRGSSDHWRSPFQSSDSYATRDLGEGWVSLSASDAAEGIGAETKNSNRHGDAFDLFCHFDHGGDFNAARQAYAKEVGTHQGEPEAPAIGQHCVALSVCEKPSDSTPPSVSNNVPKAITDLSRKKEAEETAKSMAQLVGFKTGIFRACDLDGQPVPERKWHVRDLIPSNTVTLFGGDGGTGKSLLALQLAASTALGHTWLGFAVRPGKAIYLSAEDDKAELHRRLADIVQAEGVTLANLGALTLSSLADQDALLATLTRGGTLEATGLFYAIEELLKRDRPELLVLDTLADYFPGNENDRAQARQFIGMLRGLAIRHDCAVVMLAHPSLTGINSGTGASGSTGWSNSVRSRLYLSRVVQGGSESNPDARVLRSMKANYSRTGVEITLIWQNGVFMADAPLTGSDRIAASAKPERVFLKLLDEFSAEGRHVKSAVATGYAPKVFVSSGRAEGITKQQLHQAMERLFASKQIVEVLGGDGPPSKQTKRIVRA